MWHKRILLSIILLTGCWSTAPKSTKDLPKNLSFELYLSRASLQKAEYEQYKLTPVGIFVECGTLRGGRQSAQQQDIHDVDDDRRSAFTQLLQPIFARMTRPPPPRFDQPGTSTNMFDPGKMLLTIQFGSEKVDIQTSLDSVERSEGTTQTALKRAVQLIRGSIEQPPCGNTEFYGVGRTG